MVVVGLHQADQNISRQQMVARGSLDDVQYRVGVFAIFVRNEVKTVQDQCTSVRRTKRIASEPIVQGIQIACPWMISELLLPTQDMGKLFAKFRKTVTAADNGNLIAKLVQTFSRFRKDVGPPE